jgi:hypothetical protein
MTSVWRIYRKKRIKGGTISQLLDQMSPELQEHYVAMSINGGYSSIAEALSDVLIEKYFEDKNEA